MASEDFPRRTPKEIFRAKAWWAFRYVLFIISAIFSCFFLCLSFARLLGVQFVNWPKFLFFVNEKFGVIIYRVVELSLIHI